MNSLKLMPSIKQRVNLWFSGRTKQWLNKRIPAAHQQQLSNRNIFILPTQFGYAYMFSVFILFLLGTNYQNNIIILMSYLFASVFLTSMFYSFLNLSRLKFIFNSKITAYAGQKITIPLSVITSKQRYGLNFTFVKNEVIYCSVIDAGESLIEIPFISLTRGINNPGRLKISSEYALGLFVCWTHLDFDCQVITYPAKKIFNQIKQDTSQHHEELNGSQIVEGGDDFGELRQYKQGESNAQIAWKQLARGQGWLTKTTQSEVGSTVWLSLQQLPHAPIETKLEMLCFLILDHHKSNIPFGLDLEHLKVEPSTGNKHVSICLEALAFFGSSDLRSRVNKSHVVGEP